jgi:hypothetical protein
MTDRSPELEPVRYTLRPGLTTQIAISVLPGAVCLIGEEGASEDARKLKAFADEEGQLRLHVRPLAASDVPIRLVVESEAGGRVLRTSLELRADSEPTPDMPAPPPVVSKRHREGAHVRPALSEEESLRLTNDELLQRGYPPRPDPRQAPLAFSRWQKMVSRPATFVEPKTVPNPDVSHGLSIPDDSLATPSVISAGTTPQNSNNWSGFQLIASPGTYNLVYGSWRVPLILLPEQVGQNFFGPVDVSTYSAFWIGIDGNPSFGASDLIQCGTEQDNLVFSNPLTGTLLWQFSSYYAWTQFLPQQQTEQVVTGLNVNPSDEITMVIYIVGTNAVFTMGNVTNDEYTAVETPFGRTKPVLSQADWIMERPTVNNQLPDLAFYLIAVMNDAFAFTTTSQIEWYSGRVSGVGSGPSVLQETMTNGSDILSTVLPVSYESMLFFWTGFH